MSIGPVDLIAEIIYRERIWPNQLVFVGNNALEFASIHTKSGYKSLMAPISKKQISNTWMYSQCSGVVDSLSEYGFAISTVQLGHIKMLTGSVDPIQLVVDPIYG